MHIATPTQAQSYSTDSVSPSENGSPQSGSPVNGPFGDSPGIRGRKRGGAAQKKGGIGIFAKLLEGLSAKGKAGGQKTGGSEIHGSKTGEWTSVALKAGLSGLYTLDSGKTEGTPDAENSGGDGSAAAADGKKTKNSGIKGVFSGEESDSAAFLASFGPDFQAEQDYLRAGEGETALSRSARKNSGLFAGGEGPAAEKLSAGEANSGDGVPSAADFTGGGEGEAGDSVAGLSVKRAGAGIPPDTEASRAEKAGISGRTPADLSSAGAETGENGLFQARNTAGEEAGSSNFQKRNGENSRLSELRGKKGREKLEFEGAVLEAREGPGAETGNGAGSGVKETAFDAFRPGTAEIELPVDLNYSAGGSADGKSGRELSGQRFENALAAELRGNLSTDIVREAAVIVRSGGEGSIRLSLRPETLGNIKIRLEMAENKITGHIIVESNEAFRAFERELPVLEKAFRDSGFSETSLDMSFARDGNNYGSAGDRQDGDFSPFTPVLASSCYEAGIDRVEEPLLSEGVSPAAPGRTPVNLLV